MQTWKKTTLWARLETTKEAATLIECMDAIEATLASGGTAPIDFTLHDAEHSFRVAQRAAELIPGDADNCLSEIELAQLLLASYLHDIGMSPGRDLYVRHRNYLLTGESKYLSKPELDDLQKWLDEARGGVVAPISSVDFDENGILRIDEILAYYCRHRHNDWSENWIREHLIDLKNPLYHGWVDDLVALCRSHHESLLDLRADRFDIRVLGGKGQVLNLRYLAALLRVADVLEFDPERTPEVVMKHRGIAPNSKVYWQKDHSIGFNLSRQETSMIMSARTPDAVVHKAVLETVSWVDAELNTCATLQNEGLFKKGNVPEADKARYIWPWPPQVRQDVRERDTSFVYIDGGFRPDKVKILHLLSGTNLYGNKWAAVRELLQNAVDAVREQIARERLEKDSPAKQEWEALLGASHRIRISFETDGEHFYLICHDDGVGMDKNIIANHLLVSGSGKRGDLVALERAAGQIGFSIGRTGQFGIGLLSYFMIADQVMLQTRRSSQGGDSDGKGWRFTIDGIDGFGELRAEGRASAGTKLSLRLKKETVGDDPRKFARALFGYVRSTIAFSPCPIDLVDQVGDGARCTLSLGWTQDEDAIHGRIVSKVPQQERRGEIKYLPHDEDEKMRLDAEEYARAEAEIERVSRILGPIDSSFDDVGHYRAWLAYLTLDGGNSLSFIDLNESAIRPLPDRSDLVDLKDYCRFSWRGFTIGHSYEAPDNLLCEVNLTEGSDIYVDRRGLRNGPSLDPALATIHETLLRQFLHENAQSQYSLLNLRHAVKSGIENAFREFEWEPYWAIKEGGTKKWQKISYPCVDVVFDRYLSFEHFSGCSHGEQKYFLLSPLALDQYNNLHISRIIRTGKIRIVDLGHFKSIAFVWHDEKELRGGDKESQFSEFPPGWDRLTAIFCATRAALNANNPVVVGIGNLDPLDICKTIPELVDKVMQRNGRDEMRRLLLANANHEVRFWNGLRDNFGKEFRHLIDTCELPEGEVVFWHMQGNFRDDCTIILTHQGAVQTYSASNGDRGLLLPDGSVLDYGEALLHLNSVAQT